MVRNLAKRRTGKKIPSAADPAPGTRAALYGSGLQGKKIKDQIARLAGEQSEAIYQAIIETRQAAQDSTTLSQAAGFDPTRPLSPDWQKVLEKVADRYFDSLTLKKSS